MAPPTWCPLVRAAAPGQGCLAPALACLPAWSSHLPRPCLTCPLPCPALPRHVRVGHGHRHAPSGGWPQGQAAAGAAGLSARPGGGQPPARAGYAGHRLLRGRCRRDGRHAAVGAAAHGAGGAPGGPVAGQPAVRACPGTCGAPGGGRRRCAAACRGQVLWVRQAAMARMGWAAVAGVGWCQLLLGDASASAPRLLTPPARPSPSPPAAATCTLAPWLTWAARRAPWTCR